MQRPVFFDYDTANSSPSLRAQGPAAPSVRSIESRLRADPPRILCTPFRHCLLHCSATRAGPRHVRAEGRHRGLRRRQVDDRGWAVENILWRGRRGVCDGGPCSSSRRPRWACRAKCKVQAKGTSCLSVLNVWVVDLAYPDRMRTSPDASRKLVHVVPQAAQGCVY